MMVQEKQASTFATLKEKFGYTNVFSSPRLVKIVVSSGVGKLDKNKKALVESRLARITGQKASARAAKQSIAQFKLREGDIVGFQVTLRGTRMNHFLEKLIHIALPRTRDFRGLPAGSSGRNRRRISLVHSASDQFVPAFSHAVRLY